MEFFIAIKGNNAVRTQEHHPSNSSSRKVTGISEEIVLIKSDFLHYDEVLSWLARVLRAADSIYSPMPSGFLLFPLHLSRGTTTSSHLFHGATQVFYPDLSPTLDSRFLSLSPHSLHCALVLSSPEQSPGSLFTTIRGILPAPHPKFTINLLKTAN